MPVKFGILSAASIVPRVVAGMHESPVATPLAIAARSQTKAQQLAAQCHIATVAPTYTALVDNPQLDAVYIPTYNAGHFPLAKLALEHHQAVLLEKPFTMTVTQANDLFDLAQRNQVLLMEAQKAVFLPITQQIKQLLQAGTLGTVRTINITEYHPRGNPTGWFTNRAAGGGALYGSGAYALDYLQYLLAPTTLEVTGVATIPTGLTDTQAALSLSLDDCLVNLLITAAQPQPSQMVIHGDLGTITIPNYWKTDHATLALNDQPPRQLKVTQQSEFVFEINHFCDLLSHHQLTSPVMTPAITKQTIQLIEHCYTQWYH
ncbi:gfo/Idh/MocA family oxidoreductase [Lactobacillus sp. CBA3606]|uniref:Gfo/Idh/MocA family protein n=1 Tax=Lactobacillus sp. CBA3606 TaxID=2099789 RepID=UPI000CFB83F1|nr:Gfo/Idh/MocA family oxidoreductase [Lactobacillus sp. CBA3606]AVK64823.1 gfo/Idh/MocA family oxidoreductase [Lactobacillus sp. CBA3606]